MIKISNGKKGIGMSKIINRCLLLISTIMFWVTGIVMLSDIQKEIKNGEKLLKANIFPYTLETVITEGLNSFNSIKVFVIVVLSIMMLLTLFLIVDLFFDINSLFAKITKICIISVIIFISILFLSVYVTGAKVNEKLSLIDTEIADLLTLSLFIMSMASSYTSILSMLLFGTIALLFASIISENETVKNKVLETASSDVKEEMVIDADNLEATYQNAIKRKIAETEEKLKTKELEKELEDKINELRKFEDKK